jgi:enoyl-CoA hydratase/carnithine racemase
MIDDLNDALDSIEDHRQLYALSISGNGRAFCAGADLKAAKERMGAADTAAINSLFLEALHRLLLRVEAFPTPIFTAVNGLTLSGGLELVMACNLVIAAESAKFGDAMPITAWCQVTVIPSDCPARLARPGPNN